MRILCVGVSVDRPCRVAVGVPVVILMCAAVCVLSRVFLPVLSCRLNMVAMYELTV